MTDESQLKKLQAGSEGALEWFIGKYTPYVTTIIHNVLGDRVDMGDVEETASEVFYALWEKADTVRSVKGFLGAAARNMAINRCRKLGWELPLEEDILLVDEVTPEAQVERKQLRSAVRRAVLAMPQPDKEIFLRFYFYCQSLEEIGRALHMNPSTVKTKLHRGRRRLRDALAQYVL